MAQITVNIPQPTPQVALSISPSAIGEDFGTTTVTATLNAVSTDDVEVTLNFGGTATETSSIRPAARRSLSRRARYQRLDHRSPGCRSTPSARRPSRSVFAQSTLFNATPGSSPTPYLPRSTTLIPLRRATSRARSTTTSISPAPCKPVTRAFRNVLVYLDDDGSQNGAFNVATDPFIFTSAAGASQGNYTFFGLANGSYNVFQVVPPSIRPDATGAGAQRRIHRREPAHVGLNFGDAGITNPGPRSASTFRRSPTTSSSGTLTISLARATAAPVSFTILVGGLAPFADYTLTGPSGLVTLSAASPTLRRHDRSGSNVGLVHDQGQRRHDRHRRNDHLPGGEHPEQSRERDAQRCFAGRRPRSSPPAGSPALVIDSPTQLSSTGLNPGFSFGAATNTFTAGDQPDFITSADLNGNGIPDLIVANSQASSITVILDPTSANPVTKTYSVGPNPTGIVAADFNGDGCLDLAVSTPTGVSILQNNGYGCVRPCRQLRGRQRSVGRCGG